MRNLKLSTGRSNLLLKLLTAALCLIVAGSTYSSFKTYSSPEENMVVCDITSITATPGVCNPNTGNFSLQVDIDIVDVPIDDTLTIMIGGVEVMKLPPVQNMEIFIVGLDADGSMQTVTAMFNQDPACMNSTTFMAPVSCNEPALISDAVILDEDKDGRNDRPTNDQLLSGVIVSIFNAGDTTPVVMGASGPYNNVDTTVNGRYRFGDLLPGDYLVKFDISSLTDGEYVYSYEGATTEGRDSDVPQGPGMDGCAFTTDPITVDYGDTLRNVDANVVLCELELQLTPTKDTCLGTDPITLTVNALNGAGMPSGYTYQWMEDGSPVGLNSSMLIVDPAPTVTTLYEIIVTDDLGCSSRAQVRLVECASLGNLVFYDINQNGLQDLNEPGVEGLDVGLLDKDMNPVENPMTMGDWVITTSSDGMYSFDNIPLEGSPLLDTFFVQFNLSSYPGAQFTPIQSPEVNGPNVSSPDTDLDSDVFAMTGKSDTIILSDTVLANIDAGIIGTNAIGSFVFSDNNGDGLQDVNDTPLEGIMVYLKLNGEIVDDTLTDIAGEYIFENLLGGPDFIYSIQYEQPTGYVPTIFNEGLDMSIDSDADPANMLMTADYIFDASAMNETFEDFDAGFFIPADIGDTVFVDLNGNGFQDALETGIPGVEVRLFRIDENTGMGIEITDNVFNIPFGTVTTDPNGYYKFENLRPGEYYVEFDISASLAISNSSEYFATTKNVDANLSDDIDSDINLDEVSDTIFVESDTIICSLDAGYFLPVSIGDTVFLDNNGNGIQDLGEPGIANVKVNLYKLENNVGVLQTEDYVGNDQTIVFTNADGYYKFDTLAPGQYYVEFDIDNAGNGTNFYQTYDHIPTGAFNVPTDSDIEMDNLSDTSALLTSGEMDCTLDAGFFSPVSIGDTAWLDANLNGIYDTGEPGLPGVTATLFYFNPDTMDYIEVTSDIDGNLIEPAVTDINGRYKFDNLPPGEYFVVFDAGGIPTTLEDVGADDLVDSDINLDGNSDTLIVASLDTMNCSFDAGYIGLDYGDLPESYVTSDSMNSSNAPKHVIVEDKFLGQKVDLDMDGAPTADGNGDDDGASSYIAPAGQTGSDDEDGIEFLTPLIPGNTAYIKVTYTAINTDTAYLNAFIDFAGDGSFDTGDNVMFTSIDGVATSSTDNLGLDDGSGIMVVLGFDVPETATFSGGLANARFRFSCAGSLFANSGLALDGEIEDYVIPVGKIGNLVWLDETYDGVQDTLTGDEEPGIEGAEIVMRYAFNDAGINLVVVDTVTTDVDGLYSFCGLIASPIGTYELIAITPEGLIATLDNVGDDVLDSDGDNFFDLGKDSVSIDPFMIIDPIDFAQGEYGINDEPNIVNLIPDSLFDQTYDFGFVPQDFGDLPNMDFGDLPFSYDTLNGVYSPARAIVSENKRLGSCIDSEGDLQQDMMAMGDDMNSDSDFTFGDCAAGNDEDGIQFLTPLLPGDTAYLKVTYTLPFNPLSDTAGYLNAFIDFDSTGNFNEGDSVIFFGVDGVELVDDTYNLALPAGADTMLILGFLIPEEAILHNGSIYSRFRLSCDGGLAPNDDPNTRPVEGEVEDYVKPLAKLGNTIWLDKNFNGVQDSIGTPNEEEGIEEVSVILDYEIENPLVMGEVITISDTIVTDEDGLYSFCGLIAGTGGSYKISVITPEDFTPTFADATTVSDSLDSDNAINMGDSLVMTEVFTIEEPVSLPTGEDGINDDPNMILTFVDSLIDQTIDFGFTPLDFGDIDSSYVTVQEDGGPFHAIDEAKFLGASVDAERDATVDSLAGALIGGDDNTISTYLLPDGAMDRDDENGITFITPLIPGYKATISVSYTLEDAPDGGFLNGWIDFDGNGMFDPAEALSFYSDGVAASTDALLAEGSDQVIELCFDVPADAVYNNGSVYARFRMSCVGGLEPTGGIPGEDMGAPIGEVEDYVLPLAKIGNLSWYDDNLNGVQEGTDVVPNEVGVPATRLRLTYAGYNSTDFSMDTMVYEVETDGDGIYTFCGLIEGAYDLIATKYVEDAATPEDTIPVRYILTIGNNTDQSTEDDVDSDFVPSCRFDIPNLYINTLTNADDGDPQNEEGYLDDETEVGSFPDGQTLLTKDLGWIPEPNLEVVTNIPGVQPPASGTCGHFNVIVDMCIKNTGFVDKDGVLVGANMTDLIINLDMDSLFGGAFVDVVGDPVVLSELEYTDELPINTPSVDSLPTANTGYDGAGDINTLNIDGVLQPDEEICVRVIVEVAPEDADVIPEDDLAFSAEVVGTATNSLGQIIPDYFNGGDPFMAVDTSDLNFEFDGTYEDPNEPLPLGDCWRESRTLLEFAASHTSVGLECELVLDASDFLTSLIDECHKEEYPLGGYYVIDVALAGPGTNPQLPVEDQCEVILDGKELINDSLKISVSSVSQICNSVWGVTIVQDKLDPVIACEPDTIFCYELNLPPVEPEVEDNCEAEITLVRTSGITPIDCDELFVGKMVRTWIAEDWGGNKDTCYQDVYLRRFPVNDVIFPDNLGDFNDNALECSDDIPMVDGFPDPQFTGVPTLNGVKLFPLETEIACNTYVEYEDEEEITPCRRRIKRTWRVGEWYCRDLNERVITQFIDIIDTLPPVLNNPPADMTVSTGSRSCTAMVNFPPLNLTDDCGNGTEVDIYIDEVMTINGNGGSWEVMAGTYDIRYEFADRCNNIDDYEFTLTVVDEKSPVIICLNSTTVSLTNQGIASLKAENLDNGSFDECTDISFLARRMDTTCDPDATNWGEKVHFCCEDAGKEVMVALQVTDAGGNTNVCMVTVLVDDKEPARMICIDDDTALCTETFDLDSLSKDFGLPEIVDNCPSTNEIRESVKDNRDDCGTGSIVRTFELYNGNGDFLQTCEQIIVFTGEKELTRDDIIWPKNFHAENACGNVDLEPENLPDSSAVPILPEGLCVNVAIRKFDEVLTGTSSPEACFKILRTWKIIDWCNEIVTDEGSRFPTYEHEQIIRISNSIKPTIETACRDTIIEVFIDDCSEAGISLMIEATDDCTPADELIYKYEIDAGDDGGREFSGNTELVTGDFPIGTHRIFWEVTDRCGNTEMCDYQFTIVNKKAPSAVCLDGISTALTPMDIDSEVGNDTSLAMITARMLNKGSEHTCNYDLKFSFSEDVNDTIRVYGCGDEGYHDLQLWVTDEVGNTNFCETTVLITPDTLGDFCNPEMTANVEGAIRTEINEGVDAVDVLLIGSELPADRTKEDGYYAFKDMPIGGKYTLTPEKEDDILNGVSTLDLVLIQRHILGLIDLASPYKLIAADVNNNGSLSAADIIELRKVILGHRSEFKNNSSWRFIDAGHQFTDINVPWDDEISDNYAIPELNDNMDIDFVAVKTGDVNNDAIANSRQQIIKTRSSEAFALSLTDVSVEKGDVLTIPVMAEALEEISGFQVELKSEAMSFLGLVDGDLVMNSTNYYLDQDVLRMSISDVKLLNSTHGHLFSIKVRVNESGMLSELFSLGDQYFSAEAYAKKDLAIKDINLEWNTEKWGSFILHQNSPNPWIDLTSIGFTIPEDGKVTINIRSADGKLLKSINNNYQAGRHDIRIDGNEVPVTGIMIYEVQFGEELLNRRMIRVR